MGIYTSALKMLAYLPTPLLQNLRDVGRRTSRLLAKSYLNQTLDQVKGKNGDPNMPPAVLTLECINNI